MATQANDKTMHESALKHIHDEFNRTFEQLRFAAAYRCGVDPDDADEESDCGTAVAEAAIKCGAAYLATIAGLGCAGEDEIAADVIAFIRERLDAIGNRQLVESYRTRK